MEVGCRKFMCYGEASNDRRHPIMLARIARTIHRPLSTVNGAASHNEKSLQTEGILSDGTSHLTVDEDMTTQSSLRRESVIIK